MAEINRKLGGRRIVIVRDADGLVKEIRRPRGSGVATYTKRASRVQLETKTEKTDQRRARRNLPLTECDTRRGSSRDTAHSVLVVSTLHDMEFELVLYGLDDGDLSIVPNPYVSAALNRRGLDDSWSTSPFWVKRIR